MFLFVFSRNLGYKTLQKRVINCHGGRIDPWIKAVNGDQSKAFCKYCLRSFNISGPGELDWEIFVGNQSLTMEMLQQPSRAHLTKNSKPKLSAPTKLCLVRRLSNSCRSYSGIADGQ